MTNKNYILNYNINWTSNKIAWRKKRFRDFLFSYIEFSFFVIFLTTFEWQSILLIIFVFFSHIINNKILTTTPKLKLNHQPQLINLHLFKELQQNRKLTVCDTNQKLFYLIYIQRVSHKYCPVRCCCNSKEPIGQDLSDTLYMYKPLLNLK